MNMTITNFEILNPDEKMQVLKYLQNKNLFILPDDTYNLTKKNGENLIILCELYTKLAILLGGFCLGLLFANWWWAV